MAKLEIITYGNPVLRQKAEEVTEITKEIKSIIENMHETLGDNGIGLAAPQVGISKRILIVDLTKSKEERKITLINPRIIFKSDECVDYEEGCLSIPDVWGMVNRPKSIKIKGDLVNGKTIQIEATDLFSRVLQHELDHLDGRLFIDYLSAEDKENNRHKIDALVDANKKKFGKVSL